MQRWYMAKQKDQREENRKEKKNMGDILHPSSFIVIYNLMH